MLNNLILWVRTILMATPTQQASQKPSDKKICEAIIATMNNPRNNYDPY